MEQEDLLGEEESDPKENFYKSEEAEFNFKEEEKRRDEEEQYD
ncbi:MAG: hypothetical protein ABIC19_00740 [Patescibacteria group bacterium]